MPRTLAALCALLACLALLVGCTMDERTPELLHVADVVPREVSQGDRMEILGTGFPEGRPAKVVFEGTLHRPGRKPKTGFEIAVDAKSTSAQRVELIVSESLRSAFCGSGDEAVHTSFEGNVRVVFAGSARGMLPVKGSLRGVRLDFHPPLQKRAIVLAREREGDRILSHLGLEVAADAPSTLGLLVTQVRPGSPADEVGIFAGDLITRFEGVRVFGRGDIATADTSRVASIGFVRGMRAQPVAGSHEGRELVRSISTRGLEPSAPPSLIVAGLLLLLSAIGIVAFIGPLGRGLVWLERRIASSLEPGPSRSRKRSTLSALRSFFREDVLPDASADPYLRLAPYLVVFGISAIFVMMPFGQHIVAADLDLGLLFIVAATLLVTMGLLSGGSSPDWSFTGGLRTAAQIISHEIPGGIAIACIVLMTGSLRIDEIVHAQGALPWQWFVFRSPVTFALFLLWLATSLFEGKRPAENAGIESRPSPELSGLRRFFVFFAEWGNVFVMCGLASVLFLGGWQLPFVPRLTQESSLALTALGAAWFLLKSWSLVFLVAVARRIFPRPRMEQMLAFSWKWLVPATLAALVLTALWIQWSPPLPVQNLVSVGTFAMWLLFAGNLVLRLRQGMRAGWGQAQVNPFL